jgi:hypothetical protein
MSNPDPSWLINLSESETAADRLILVRRCGKKVCIAVSVSDNGDAEVMLDFAQAVQLVQLLRRPRNDVTTEPAELVISASSTAKVTVIGDEVRFQITEAGEDHPVEVIVPPNRRLQLIQILQELLRDVRGTPT